MARDLPSERPNAGRPAERARDLPMTPAERRAVARAVKIASGKQAAKRRRDTERERVAAKIRAGKYVTPEDRKRLVKAGVDFGFSKDIVGQTVSNLVDAAANTPAGLYEVGKAVTLDTADIATGRIRKPGDLGKRSRKVGGAVVKSTVETVKHPLRRPGDTLLLALGAFGGGAGLASRGAAASSAIKAGEGVGRALVRPGYEGGSVLRRPAPGVRRYGISDLEVPGIYSANAGIRAVQKASDKIVEKASGTGAGETLQIRRTGKQLGQNRVVAEAKRRGPAKQLAKMGRRLTGPQQQALRVWGQGLTVDEKVAQYGRNLDAATKARDEAIRVAETAEDAGERARARATARHYDKVAGQLNRKIALTHAARPYMDGTELATDFGRPRHGPANTRRGANASQLRAVAEQADRVAGKKPGGRERALLDAGLLEPEQIDFRLHAPGRIGKGATWATAADVAVRRLDEIQRKRDALRPTPTRVPGKKVVTERPRSRAEAEARLAELDDVLNPLIDQWAKELEGAERAARKGQEGAAVGRHDYWINRYGKKEGSRIAQLPDEDRAAEGFIQGQRKGYKQGAPLSGRDIAEEILSQIAGRDPVRDIDLSTLLTVRKALEGEGIDFRKLRAALDQRDELRRAVSDAQAKGTIFEDDAAAAPDFGTVKETKQTPDRIVPGKLDDQAREALAELDRQEVRAFELLDRGDDPVLEGFEDFEGGRFRVPDVPEKMSRTPIVGRGSVYRGGQPQTPPSLRRRYTGRLEETGGHRVNTTVETARSALEAHKYTNLLDLRDQVLKAGVDARPRDTRLVQWVPVRKQRLTAKQRRTLTETQPLVDTERLPVTEAEKAAAGSQWEKFLEDVFPEKQFANVPEGGKVPNVVWVPRQMLANMNKPFARSGWAPGVAAVDTVLNLVKFGVIPAKTAYVTANAAGNALFNVAQQGVFLPRNWKQATSLLRDPEIAATVREVMGSGGMQALLSGNPKGAGVLNTALHAYGNAAAELMLEPMMRVSALVHEARRFGFKTNADIKRLLTDPRFTDEAAVIARRSKNAIVDYDRLGPFEKSVARRGLFIYPWVKGATLYGGHFLLEHPVQASVYSQVANVGREKAEEELGPVPSWARGTFKVGGSRDMPLVVNPSSISTVSQAGEILSTAWGSATGGGRSADQLGGLLHPAIQAGIEAGFQRDLFTGAPLKGGFPELLARRSIAQTAPAVLLGNLERAGQPAGRRVYPMTKTQAILRNTVGAFMPRTAQRKALNEAARVEAEHNLTPGSRARRSVFRERQAIFQTMKAKHPELLENGRLPGPVRQAYNRKANVEAARRLARNQARGDSATYYRKVAVAEARLLEKWGALPKGSAARIEKAVETMGPEAVKEGVDRMRSDLMPGAYRDVTSAGRKYLERNG